jgi:N-succinyl-L-ornithine transcarbamylase
MALTNNAKFMHCLPVRRNMIVTDAVLDSENSIVMQQAANRTVAMQTILKRILRTQ